MSTGEIIGQIIVIIIMVIFFAIFTYAIYRRGRDLGLDSRHLRNVTITAVVPFIGWAIAYMYLVCYKYEVNFWYWLFWFVVLGSSVIGIFIWLALFITKVQAAKEGSPYYKSRPPDAGHWV